MYEFRAAVVVVHEFIVVIAYQIPRDYFSCFIAGRRFNTQNTPLITALITDVLVVLSQFPVRTLQYSPLRRNQT